MQILPNPLVLLKLGLATITLTILLSTKVGAASLFLSPATGNASDEEFNITVSLDTESNENIEEIYAYIAYDPKVLSVTRVDNGTLDNYFVKDINTATGVISISANQDFPINANDIYTVAKIHFLAKKTTGSVNVTVLEENPNKSQVLDTNANNVLSGTVDSSLQLAIDSLTTTQSSNVNIPSTGAFNPLKILVFTIFMLALGLLIRNYAYTKL
jgi:hypothetical protein